MPTELFKVELQGGVRVLRLSSPDGTNRLTRQTIAALHDALGQWRHAPRPVVLTGNREFFSVGADLNEVAALTGPEACAFSRMGQSLMDAIDGFPATVYAAVSGYCLGGGLDLALACHRRIASPRAILGHRGAAFGLVTGWGGTQRLPRLIGKGNALQMFALSQKMDAGTALRLGLVDALADDPVKEAIRRISSAPSPAGGPP